MHSKQFIRKTIEQIAYLFAHRKKITYKYYENRENKLGMLYICIYSCIIRVWLVLEIEKKEKAWQNITYSVLENRNNLNTNVTL